MENNPDGSLSCCAKPRSRCCSFNKCFSMTPRTLRNACRCLEKEAGHYFHLLAATAVKKERILSFVLCAGIISTRSLGRSVCGFLSETNMFASSLVAWVCYLLSPPRQLGIDHRA